MLKIRIYDNENEIELEKRLNNLIKQLEEHEQEIIDIKYQVAVSKYEDEEIFCYSALVMYDDKLVSEYKPKKFEIVEKVDD